MSLFLAEEGGQAEGFAGEEGLESEGTSAAREREERSGGRGFGCYEGSSEGAEYRQNCFGEVGEWEMVKVACALLVLLFCY